MADVQQGGSDNAGQATIGDSRKLTQSEAGFREGQGIPGLRCGECAFFEAAQCQIVEGPTGQDDVCDEFEPNTKDGHMSADQTVQERGGPGSGHFGHEGRQGEVGGSLPSGETGSAESSQPSKERPTTGKGFLETIGGKSPLTPQERKKIKDHVFNPPSGQGLHQMRKEDINNTIDALSKFSLRELRNMQDQLHNLPMDEHHQMLAKVLAAAVDKREFPQEKSLAARDVPAVEMFITRVSEDKQTGVRRWYAVSSGTKWDLYKERMSVALYKDFIRRIEEKEPAPVPFASEAWNGGLPYLGVAHYLDMNGEAIVGPTDQVWIDGKLLKARGRFNQSPLGEASYNAIEKDRLTNRAQAERTRISIAFIDWAHDHGKGRGFTRKSLTDMCPLCEAGVGNKTYTKGQLVHLALTRRPAYPESSIEALEVKSMSKRRDDAASIIGDELADDLERRSKELIGRSNDEESGVAPGAVVVRDEPGAEEDVAVGDATLGGALTLDDAEAFLTRSEADPPILDSWGIFATVLCNHVEDDEKRAAIREVVRDFQSTLDVQALEALMDVRRALGGEPVTETKEDVERAVPPQFRKDKKGGQAADSEAETQAQATADQKQAEAEGPAEGEVTTMTEEEKKKQEAAAAAAAGPKKSLEDHPLGPAIMRMLEAFDEAVDSPISTESRLSMMQQSFNELGGEIKEKVAEVAKNAPLDSAAIERAVADAVAPLLAQISALSASVQAGTSVQKSLVPGRRAIRMPTVPLPQGQVTRSEKESSEDNPTPKIRLLARRSTIGFEKGRGR
jgi:hypothetical protein